MPTALPTGALQNTTQAAGLPERMRPSPHGNGAEPEAQYVDFEVPRSPPRLHEIHRSLQALGVHVGSVRSRVAGDRLALSVQVAEIDGGPLCAARLAEVAQALTRFACRTGPALARAASRRLAVYEPPTQSGVHRIVRLGR